MELKYLTHAEFLYKMRGSNRTFMELKWRIVFKALGCRIRSNRTFMELK